jgi:hypothetical protein
MEVDGEVGMGGVVSKSLSQLSLDGGDAPVAAELGMDLTDEPLEPRSSQDPVVSKDIKFTEKKSQKVQPYVDVPPLPDYVLQSKGKERAPVEAEDEEGLFRVSVQNNWFLTHYSSRRSGTSSYRRFDVF